MKELTADARVSQRGVKVLKILALKMDKDQEPRDESARGDTKTGKSKLK